VSTVAVYDLRKLSTLLLQPQLVQREPGHGTALYNSLFVHYRRAESCFGPVREEERRRRLVGRGRRHVHGDANQQPVTAKAPQNRAARRMAEEMNLQLTRPTLKSAG